MTTGRQFITGKLPFILGFILLLGLGLRVYRLGAEGIWLDEGVTIARATSPVARLVSGQYPDPSPPLYYLILHFWIKAFGTSELALRLPSVIFGALAILLLYRTGTAIFNRATGTLAALIIALAALPVYFSREARMYPLLLLLSLTSFYCLIRMLRGEGTKFRVLYLLSTVGLLYTHNLGLSTVLAQNIFLLLVFREPDRSSPLSARTWYGLQSLLLLLYLPGLAAILGQFRSIHGAYWTPAPSGGDLLVTFAGYGGSTAAGAVLLLLAAVALLPAGVRGLIRETSENDFLPRSGRLLAIWLLTPILLPFLVSLSSTAIYIPRITIAAVPALYLLAARGAARIAGRWTRPALAALLALLLLLPLKDFYRPPRNEPWREVVRLVEQEARPGDEVIISPPWYRGLCFEHYRTRNDVETRGAPEELFAETGLNRLAKETARRRTWLIYFSDRNLTSTLAESFPKRFRPAASRVEEYFNFQAGRRMGIRIYLLAASGED